MDHLLRLAIEDNVRWCSAVCKAHGADDILSTSLWLNHKPSPRYYPNIISREPGAQAQISKEIERLRALDTPVGWGIKDSFADLALAHLGFEAVVNGSWFGGVPDVPAQSPEHWKKALSVGELRNWEAAWDGESDHHIFPDALLTDSRIEFWYKTVNGAIDAGFICFHTEYAVGLSNWFSQSAQSIFDIGAFDIIGANFPGVPVVFWSSDDNTPQQHAVARLAPLKVWICKF